MMFWLAAALLTVVVITAILWPLVRGAKAPVRPAAHDVVVYRDQLAELDRDVAAGNLPKGDAEIARAEIARRLIRASGEEQGTEGGALQPGRSWRGVAAIVIVVFVPVLGLGCYLLLGSPGLPSEPLASREAGQDGDPQLARLVSQAEEHLQADPDDGRGWDVLAPIYARTGRLEDARVAYGNAIRLLGSTARREGGLGETLVISNGGKVTDAARAAFERALKLKPDDPKATFYLALRMAQDGKSAEALQAFQAMAKSAPPDAPWLPTVKAEIAALSGGKGGPGGMPQIAAGAGGAASPPGNPTPEEMAAAQNMSAGDRMAMIRGMVGGLDERLAAQPDDVQGWMRLVRSYMVLKEPAKAKDALNRALKTFPVGTEEGNALTGLAAQLGITTAEAGQ